MSTSFHLHTLARMPLRYHQAYLYIVTQRQKDEAFFTLDKKFIDPKLIQRRYSDSIVSPKISQIGGGNRIVKKKSQSWSGSDIEKALADPTLPDVDLFISNLRKMNTIGEEPKANNKPIREEERGLLPLRRVDEEKYGAISDDAKDESKKELTRKISTDLRLNPVPYNPVPESWHWLFRTGLAWAIIAITLVISVLALVLQIISYVDSALNPTPPCVPNVTGW